MEKTVYAIKPAELIEALADKLRKIKEFAQPDWALFVKTSCGKERPPFVQDWWFKRSASILRQLYIKGQVGVGHLRTKYGSKQDRGSKPSKFRKGSGKIIRTILQKAEAVGLVEKVKGKRHGRRLTAKGKDFLDLTAKEIAERK